MNFLNQIADSKVYKALMPILYGWGAALVILGALFKILSLNGADIMLMAGMGTEAFIFFMSAFEQLSEMQTSKFFSFCFAKELRQLSRLSGLL